MQMFVEWSQHLTFWWDPAENCWQLPDVSWRRLALHHESCMCLDVPLHSHVYGNYCKMMLWGSPVHLHSSSWECQHCSISCCVYIVSRPLSDCTGNVIAKHLLMFEQTLNFILLFTSIIYGCHNCDEWVTSTNKTDQNKIFLDCCISKLHVSSWVPALVCLWLWGYFPGCVSRSLIVGCRCSRLQYTKQIVGGDVRLNLELTSLHIPAWKIVNPMYFVCLWNCDLIYSA